jgi:hypothetical protein
MRKRFARLLIKVAARLLAGGDNADDAAALHHVYVSARLAGWSDAGARDAARVMLSRGIHPVSAQRMFDDSGRRVQ